MLTVSGFAALLLGRDSIPLCHTCHQDLHSRFLPANLPEEGVQDMGLCSHRRKRGIFYHIRNRHHISVYTDPRRVAFVDRRFDHVLWLVQKCQLAGVGGRCCQYRHRCDHYRSSDAGAMEIKPVDEEEVASHTNVCCGCFVS
jgi:hypothetical protein